MSRLREIFVVGGESGCSVMRESLDVVLQLCEDSYDAQRKLHHAIASTAALSRTEYEVPQLWTALAHAASRSRNCHYQQLIIVVFILFDPQLFGAYMLHGEPELLRTNFLAVLKDATSYFITGHRMDGTAFAKEDELLARNSGHFVCWLRDNFASL